MLHIVRKSLAVTSLLIVILFGSSASAQVATTIQSGVAEEPPKKLTLSFSPVHLLYPVVEVTGEYAVSQNFGLAGIAGFGGGNGFYFIDVGAQGIYYLTGDFDGGLQIGGEAVYSEIGGNIDGEAVALLGGLGIAPFLGYKMSSRRGLTGILQAGPQLMVAATNYDSAAGIGIMLNLNVGWSF